MKVLNKIKEKKLVNGPVLAIMGGCCLRFWAQKIQARLTLPDPIWLLTGGVWWSSKGKALDLERWWVGWPDPDGKWWASWFAKCWITYWRKMWRKVGTWGSNPGPYAYFYSLLANWATLVICTYKQNQL